MSILFSWLSPLRAICMAIDGVAFSLLDNAYELVISLSTAEVLQRTAVKTLTSNLYILIGVIAFFRLALVLVNSIINPEKLNEKGKGLSNIFFRVVGMIALLIVTPFLFDMSYELQARIVGADTEKNLIFKTILGDKANMGGENAGKAMKNIALSSLITVNENYVESFHSIECISNGDGTCTNQGGYVYNSSTCNFASCKEAVSRYNDLYVNENMSPWLLAKYVGASSKIDGEEVFVYDYMLIITTAVGIFMTYVIISFAIDIAVRLFELLVLEILSPLFIATFVDPKSTQSGPFKNWISAVGKSYATLYIRLAILALMILLISIVNQSTMTVETSGWTKIFIVIGLLIFAKKAPKWISDIVGIKDDGISGLGIGKKLGGMALAGGLASKASDGIKKGLKKQGDKILDHGKKRIGNMGDKLLAGYAVRRQVGDKERKKAREKYAPQDGSKMKLADRIKANREANAKIKEKVAATRADIQADFKANNDMRAFASLRDKYAEHAQRVNPSYQTKRQKELDTLNQKAEDLKEAAGIDSSSMAKERKNAQDIRKATAIYGEDFVKQHIKPDGSLDKVACPVSEQQINNAYTGVLTHPPTSLADIATAQLKIEGITVTDDAIKARIDSFGAYTKALYNSAVFENNALNQSNYISSEEGKAKADKELAELYAQLQSYKNSAPSVFDESTPEGIAAKEDYDKAIETFNNLIDSKQKTSDYYAARIKEAKENFTVEFPELTLNDKGVLVGSGITEKSIKDNDAVVEVNGEYITKFGKFYKQPDGTYTFKQEDMTQQLELINTEHEGKRSGKIKNALEAAKPAELKAAEKNDGK